MMAAGDARAILQGLRIPVIGAPMFLVSGPDLVIEQCKAGILGAFPALNARPQELLDTWLTQIEDALEKHRREHPGAIVAPYGVNLIVNPANKRLEEDAQTCIRHKVPVVAVKGRPRTGQHPFDDVCNAQHLARGVGKRYGRRLQRR